MVDVTDISDTPTNNFLFAKYDAVITRANLSKGDDPWGYRTEFINLVEVAKTLSS